MRGNSLLVLLAVTFTALMMLPGVPHGYVESKEGNGPETKVSGVGVPDPTILYDNVNTLTNDQNGPRRSVLNVGNTVFAVYFWVNGSYYTLSMKRSLDSGNTWSGSIDVFAGTQVQSGKIGINPHIMAWKGEIYVFIHFAHGNRDTFPLYVKHTKISTWTYLRNVSLTLIDYPSNVFDVAYDDNYIYLVSTTGSGTGEAFFHRYNGFSWSSRYTLSGVGDGTKICMAVYKSGSTTKLLVFYANIYCQYTDGRVYMRTSTNSGSSWTAEQPVLGAPHTSTVIGDNDFLSLQCLNANGTLILLAAHMNQNDDISMTISRDGGSTWTSRKYIVQNRGADKHDTATWPFEYSFSGALKEGNRTIYLFYESSNGIKMVFSHDWGSNWLPESKCIDIGLSESFNPILSASGKYLTFPIYNVSKFDFGIMRMADFYFDDYSPRDIQVTGGFFHINITWSPPQGKIFDLYPFNGYIVYRGKSPFNMNLHRQLGNVTTFNDTITDTYDSRYYYYIVADFDRIGPSSPSSIVSAVSLATDPPVLTDLTVGDRTVSLNWIIGSDVAACGYPLDRFTVYKGRYDDAPQPIADLGPSIRSYTDTDFTYEPQGYYYWVSYALDLIGECNRSEPLYGFPINVPSFPQDLTYSQVPGGVRMEWSPPRSDGGSAVTKYEVFRGRSRTILDVMGETGPTILHFDITNLSMGDEIFVSVRAINRIGPGARCDPVFFEYMGTPSMPNDLRAVGADRTITVIWSPPSVTWGLPLTGYLVYRGVGGSEPEPHMEVSADETDFLDPVENGRTYSYLVSSMNVFGEGLPWGPVEAIASGRPGPISGFSVFKGDSQSVIKWDTLIDSNGSPLTHMNLYRSGMDAMENHIPIPISPGSYMDAGLTNGLTYSYKLSASNGNGEGPIVGPISVNPSKSGDPVISIRADASFLTIKVQ